MTYRTLTAASRTVPRSDITMVPPYARYVGSCRHGLDSVALDARSLVMGSAGTMPSILFYPVPPSGYSEIERTVTVRRHGLQTSRSERMFLFRIDADSLIDADVVDAMRYIAHDDEFDSLKTMPDSLRAGVAARFWEKHGGAARRAEFEQRVNGANKLFSVCMNGSRTPMGITYIVCGPPDYVDCRTPSTETWYYTVGSVTMPVEFRLERRDEVVSYYELTNNLIDGFLWMTFVDQWRRR
jgi:GWxTD domain-containing protein